MSLYYEAAAVLANADKAGGSLKSRLYKQQGLKSSPAQLFALISEASKWSPVLKDVIERCGLLGEERKLTPILGLLLTHDLLLSKNGVTAPAGHVLKLAVSRHKARLSAEFTKARIRGGYSTLEAFKAAVDSGALDEEDSQRVARHPRWVRINTLKKPLAEHLSTTFSEYTRAGDLGHVLSAPASGKVYFEDLNIPNLLALPPKINLSKLPAYLNGEIIFQDKASCFPAYLLDVGPNDGDAIDGCAAPGNKTTHLAAIVSEIKSANKQQKVIAFERDKARATILRKMVNLAEADTIVSIKAGADFLAAVPESEEFAHVGAILLDPSCSGSGIVGRDDALKMHLPRPPAGAGPPPISNKGKKRKRDDTSHVPENPTTLNIALEDATPEETPLEGKLSERLAALSAFQLRILTHAMRFPSARKITYSTCSVHFEENEGVVVRALASSIARERGWRILKREAQVEGLKKWHRRGVWVTEKLEDGVEVGEEEAEEICDACIRCEKGTEEGTMGFFVAGFVRDPNGGHGDGLLEGPCEEEEEWNGFSDAEEATAVVRTIPSQTSKRSKKRKKGNGG